MCDETIKYEIDLIKHKSFYRLAEALKSARKEVCSESELTASTEARTARHFVLYTFAIAEYRAKTHAHMFPAALYACACAYVRACTCCSPNYVDFDNYARAQIRLFPIAS